jgi:hypothetical protein
LARASAAAGRAAVTRVARASRRRVRRRSFSIRVRMMDELTIEPTGQKEFGPCSCCGNVSRCVWGFVHGREGAVAAYFVHWTIGRVADHWPNFDLIIGRWGQGATPADRCMVALQYRLLENGPAFMVIDPDGRPSAKSELVSKALRRSEVIGSPIAAQAFGIVDAVLAQDTRVAELLMKEEQYWHVRPPPPREPPAEPRGR